MPPLIDSRAGRDPTPIVIDQTNDDPWRFSAHLEVKEDVKYLTWNSVLSQTTVNTQTSLLSEAGPAAFDAAQQKYKRLVERSEEKQKWSPDWIQIYVLDVEVDQDNLSEDLRHGAISTGRESKRVVLPVAAMILEGRSSDYTRPVLPEQDAQDPFLYVRYLVTDRRVGNLSKGAGQKLLDHADEIARSLGIDRLCLDGWNGNDYLLVK